MKVETDISPYPDFFDCETCYKHMGVVFILDIGSDVLHICKDCLIALRNAIDPLRLLITIGIDTKEKREGR